jgi:molybdopterin/thiamine biosynthesis adenylyltransferase
MKTDSELNPSPASATQGAKPAWSYEKAFCRNRGLINPQEQETLRSSRVAVAGVGGVGGIDLVTLARLGIGRFTIADPDVFEISNTNRQYGATSSTLGCSKAEVMAAIVRDINPEADVRVVREPLGPENVDAFLQDADLLVDGIDFFAMDVRRMLFARAAAKGIYGITAGPVGFSGICIVFDPHGMSFDHYFDVSDQMDTVEKVVAFVAGVAPKATQRAYLDMSAVDVNAHVGPSSSLACQLAAGAVAAQAVKILLKRGPILAAPHYHQFDPYLNRYAHGRLLGGNRHPLQKLKRWLIARFIRRQMSR